MKTFICLIRINPESLAPTQIAKLDRLWKIWINTMIQNHQLLELCIFREPGVVLREKYQPVNGYYADDHKAPVTGFVKISCQNMEDAKALCNIMPTIPAGGIVEVRELKEIKFFE